MMAQTRRPRTKDFTRRAARPIFIVKCSTAGLMKANQKLVSPQNLGLPLRPCRRIRRDGYVNGASKTCVRTPNPAEPDCRDPCPELMTARQWIMGLTNGAGKQGLSLKRSAVSRKCDQEPRFWNHHPFACQDATRGARRCAQACRRRCCKPANCAVLTMRRTPARIGSVAVCPCRR